MWHEYLFLSDFRVGCQCFLGVKMVTLQVVVV